MPNLTNTQKMYIKTVYIIFHISRGKAVFKMTGSIIYIFRDVYIPAIGQEYRHMPALKGKRQCGELGGRRFVFES